MRRRIIFGLILILIVVLAVRLVRQRKKQLMSQRVSTVAMVPVRTGHVTRGNFSGERVCYGVISSDHQAQVKARVAGRVSEILAREGDSVHVGDILLELDGTAVAPESNRRAISTAIANLERSVTGLIQTRKNLKATLDNDRMLHENDAISAQQMEQSENRYEEAGVQLSALRSELAAQKAQLAQFSVTAPFDGVVGKVLVQLGDVAAPMQPVITVENSSPCKVVVTVSAGDLSRIEPDGLAVLVLGQRQQRARISRIHPSAGPGGTGLVDIVLNQPPFELPLGASVEVRLAIDVMANVLLVPAQSVLEGVSQARVQVVESDTVRIVPVEVLAASGETMAVRGDLKTADLLVMGSDSLLMRMANGVHVAPRGDAR